MYFLESFISHNAEDTVALGKKIARHLKVGSVVSLEGVLGSGKTTMVKGIADGLNIEEHVTSPSFTIMTSYQGDIKLYHIDLYRIHSTDEILDLGIEEVFSGDGISVIEWGDRAAELLPKDCVRIRFELLGCQQRKISIEGCRPIDRDRH